MGARPTEATAERDIERLFASESPRMWRSIVGYTGDPDIASDAVAEAFTLALERSQDIASPAGWLWRVAFRIATAELKRRRQERGDVPDQAYLVDDRATEVVAALRRLSPRQRGAIVLRYYADRPIEDVARILGSTPAAVRVHLMRARRRLRELLEADDG